MILMGWSQPKCLLELFPVMMMVRRQLELYVRSRMQHSWKVRAQIICIEKYVVRFRQLLLPPILLAHFACMCWKKPRRRFLLVARQMRLHDYLWALLYSWAPWRKWYKYGRPAAASNIWKKTFQGLGSVLPCYLKRTGDGATVKNVCEEWCTSPYGLATCRMYSFESFFRTWFNTSLICSTFPFFEDCLEGFLSRAILWMLRIFIRVGLANLWLAVRHIGATRLSVHIVSKFWAMASVLLLVTMHCSLMLSQALLY